MAETFEEARERLYKAVEESVEEALNSIVEFSIELLDKLGYDVMKREEDNENVNNGSIYLHLENKTEIKDDDMEDKFENFTDEELLLELINRNVMGEAPKKSEYITPHIEVLIAIGNNETAHIRFPMEAFKELYDIVYNVKREPEIKACSNPECGWKVRIEDCIVNGKRMFYLECEKCGYVSPIADSESEAIRLHNLIADKSVKIDFGKGRE